MSDALKPCPFCGGVAIWAASEFENDFEINCSSRNCMVWIMCGGKSEEQARKAWNTRHEDQPK